MFRQCATSSDGRRFYGPFIEDDSTEREEYERLTAAIGNDELPEWLVGQVKAEDIEFWGSLPGPRYKPAKPKPGTRVIMATVAVWPDPDGGFTATLASGPLADRLYAFADTEEEARLNVARMLDTLPSDAEKFDTNVPPDVLEEMRTKAEDQPGVK